MKIINTSLLISFIALLFSCKHTITNKAKLTEYINNPDNGLKKEELVNKINTVVIYTPPEFFNPTYKKGNIQNKYLDDKLFFVLSLSSNNKELLRQLDYNSYSEMVQILSFRMNEFVELISDEKKLVEPESCQFQQTYGLSKANNLLIAFKKKDLLSSKYLILRIKEFGLNIGNLSYKFNTTDINNIPTIQF